MNPTMTKELCFSHVKLLAQQYGHIIAANNNMMAVCWQACLPSPVYSTILLKAALPGAVAVFSHFGGQSLYGKRARRHSGSQQSLH